MRCTALHVSLRLRAADHTLRTRTDAHTRRHYDHDLQRQAHAHTRVAKQPCVSGGQYYLGTSLLGTVLPRYCPDTALRGCCVSGRPHAALPCASWQLGVRGRTCVCAPARAHTRTLTHSLTHPHAHTQAHTHARTHCDQSQTSTNACIPSKLRCNGRF